MTVFFLKILNMSIVASYVILLILPLRLLLRRAPKTLSYLLWGVVLFRLLCPFSFESVFSFLAVNPTTVPQDIVYAQLPQIDSGIGVLDHAVNASLPAGTPYASANPIQMALLSIAFVWGIGVVVLLFRSIIATICLHHVLRGARHMEGNIYESSAIHCPFVFGIIHPRIYLTGGLDDPDRKMVLLHEQAHIERKDHIVKFLFFIALCIHWFNPLVWIAFRCMSRDMEMWCNGKVMRALGLSEKQQYSKALLSVAIGRSLWSASPIAFGESDVKSRVKNVLSYQKPVLWVSIGAILIVGFTTVGFMANPLSTKTTYWHCNFHTLEPEGKPYVTDIFFEISRYGYPEDHIDAYVTELLFSMMEPPTSWGYDRVELKNAYELDMLYASALEDGKVAEYVILLDREDDAPHYENEASYVPENEGIGVPDPPLLSSEPYSAPDGILEPVHNYDAVSQFGFGPDGEYYTGIIFSGNHLAGEPVIAVASGTVIFVHDEDNTPYGLMVTLDHGGGITSSYAFLETINVQDGEVVEAGQTIAVVGQSGKAIAPQLQFEMRENGVPVDPALYLDSIELYSQEQLEAARDVLLSQKEALGIIDVEFYGPPNTLLVRVGDTTEEKMDEIRKVAGIDHLAFTGSSIAADQSKSVQSQADPIIH